MARRKALPTSQHVVSRAAPQVPWWRWVGLLVAGCGADSAGLSEFAPGGPFGEGADDLPEDAATPPVSDAGFTDAAGAEPAAEVRLFHGLVNLGAVRLCHDPDFVLDDPATAEDEHARGEAVEIPLPAPHTAGLRFGEQTEYFRASMPKQGALLLVEAPLPGAADAGVGSEPDNADAGLDGATPPQGDAAVDASDGAAGGDASDGLDAGAAPARPFRLCDQPPSAVLPLPVPAWWLSSQGEPTSPEALGLADKLTGAARVTLFASGLVLTEDALAALGADAEAAHLRDEPDDLAGAATARRLAVERAQANQGPRLLPAPAQAAAAEGASLALSHLVAHLPGDDGPGTVRLCITTDNLESTALPERSDAGVPFRAHVTLADGLAPDAAYRLRAFAAQTFDQEGKDCATTSASPLAELSVDAGTLSEGKGYTLVLSGSHSPDALCSGDASEPYVEPSACVDAHDELRARLHLVPD